MANKKIQIRHICLLFSLALFPMLVNYFSPVISLYGLSQGIATASLTVFAAQFFGAFFLRRFFCGWLCPMALAGEITTRNKLRWRKTVRAVHGAFFLAWINVLLYFLLRHGIYKVDLFYPNKGFISADDLAGYLIYLIVLAVFIGLPVLLGQRGGCHAICWMSPLMVAGAKIGYWLHLPQLRIHVRNQETCIRCGNCNRACPMSIDVQAQIAKGQLLDVDCVYCRQCVATCPKHILR